MQKTKFEKVIACMMLAGVIGTLSFATTPAQNNEPAARTNFSVRKAYEPTGPEVSNLDLVSSLKSVNSTPTSVSVNVEFGIRTITEEDYTDPETGIIDYEAYNAEQARLDSLGFYIGFGTSEADHTPAELVFDVKVGNGVETRRASFAKYSINNYFDAIGAMGEPNVTLNCEIALNAGETFVREGLAIENIFRAVKNPETNRWERETDEEGKVVNYYSMAEKASTFKGYSLDDFCTISFDGFSTFGDFTMINLTTTSVGMDIYSKLSGASRYIKQNQDDIDSGKIWVRTMLSFSLDSLYHIEYGDEEQVINSLAKRVDITSQGKRIGILLQNIRISEITNITLSNYNVYMDLFNSGTHKAVPGSYQSFTFSNTEIGFREVLDRRGNVIIEKSGNPYNVNVLAIILISFSAVLLAYCGGTLALFLYQKKKYADDEFRRVRPKEFFKTAGMGLATSLSLVLLIEAIVFRASIFYTSFETFNPLDIIIVIFGVASIILVGYFVRYFAIQIKNIRQKRENDRLRLNQDKFDDGVLLMPKSK